MPFPIPRAGCRITFEHGRSLGGNTAEIKSCVNHLRRRVLKSWKLVGLRTPEVSRSYRGYAYIVGTMRISSDLGLDERPKLLHLPKHCLRFDIRFERQVIVAEDRPEWGQSHEVAES